MSDETAAANALASPVHLGHMLTTAQREIGRAGYSADGESEYLGLRELWRCVDEIAQALSHQAEEATDAPVVRADVEAAALRDSWEDLDRRYGDPDLRDWSLLWGEAMRRLEVISNYLCRSDLVDMLAHVRDSGILYSARAEFAAHRARYEKERRH